MAPLFFLSLIVFVSMGLLLLKDAAVAFVRGYRTGRPKKSRDLTEEARDLRERLLR